MYAETVQERGEKIVKAFQNGESLKDLIAKLKYYDPTICPLMRTEDDPRPMDPLYALEIAQYLRNELQNDVAANAFSIIYLENIIDNPNFVKNHSGTYGTDTFEATDLCSPISKLIFAAVDISPELRGRVVALIDTFYDISDQICDTSITQISSQMEQLSKRLKKCERKKELAVRHRKVHTIRAANTPEELAKLIEAHDESVQFN